MSAGLAGAHAVEHVARGVQGPRGPCEALDAAVAQGDERVGHQCAMTMLVMPLPAGPLGSVRA